MSLKKAEEKKEKTNREQKLVESENEIHHLALNRMQNRSNYPDIIEVDENNGTNNGRIKRRVEVVDDKYRCCFC